MKIGTPAEKPAPAPTPTPAQAGQAAATASGTAASAASAASVASTTAAAIPAQADASATIELSSAASSLLTSGSTPEFDAEKVARISKAIDDGSFKVNPEAIADKLIANAQELLGKFQS